MYFHQLELLVEKGEVPAGCNILLVGPSGSGKTVLCDTLLCEGLDVGQTCLYITMKMDPNLLRHYIRLSELKDDEVRLEVGRTTNC